MIELCWQRNVTFNTFVYLSHHPNMWSIPAAVVWDAVTNAGGAISQDNTKVSKLEWGRKRQWSLIMLPEGPISVAPICGVSAPADGNVLLIIVHTLEAANIVHTTL